MKIGFTSLVLFGLLHGVCFSDTPGVPRAVFVENTFNFGKVKQGEKITHKFQVKNEGTAPLLLDRVDFNLPTLTAKFKPEIPPGGEGFIQVDWNTTSFSGPIDLEAELSSNDPVQPKFTFTLSGLIDPVIEVDPISGAYISLYPDEKKEQTLHIINHEQQPLKISSVEKQGTHFTASLKEVQPGNSYDLTITVPAGTRPGRYEEGLLLHTNHPKFSKVPVGVNVLVMRDLHAFPEIVDFKGIDLSILKQNPGLIDNLFENIIVENRRGDFEIKSIQTDVPFLKITQAPTSGRSSRFKLDIQVLKEKLAPGKISGSIQVATDVKESPEITIPVVAEIQ
jgi:Protein of unknown function (DUF1573)